MSKQNLIADINEILFKHGVKERISCDDVTITEKIVSDLVKSDAKLSNAIIGYLWSSISSAEVYHYTSREAAENILKDDGKFRLTNIAKRYSEDEIITFCKSHQLNGYLENDKNGEPIYKDLIMSNTFYASFADTNITKEQDDKLWRQFASCNGVRLKVKITAKNSDFRKICYEQAKGKPIPLLFELITCVRQKYSKEFILKGISRLCAFYLPSKYEDEKEYRMMYRVWDDSETEIKTGKEVSYIELPLNIMSKYGYQLDIIEVCADSKPKYVSTYHFSKRFC